MTEKPKLEYQFYKNPATGNPFLKIIDVETKRIKSKYELPVEWKDLSDDEKKKRMKEYDWESAQYGSTKLFVVKSKKIKLEKKDENRQ